MSLNDLFAANTTIRLSSDTNTWSDQIVNALISKFPTLSKMVGEIHISKVDSIKGNALGYISLIGKPQQRIPFIVDQMELNPLDIYIDNGMYLPLTENSVSRIEKADWPFRLLSQTERTGLMKVATSLYEDTGKCELKESFINKHAEELGFIAKNYPDIIEKYSSRNEVENVEAPEIAHFFVKEAVATSPVVKRDLKTSDKEYKISEIAKMYGKEFVTKLMNQRHLILSNVASSVELKLFEKEVHSAYKPTTTNVGFIKNDGELIPAKRFDHYFLSNLKKKSSINSNIVITKNGVLSHEPLYNLETPKTVDFSFSLDPVKPGDYAGIVFGSNFYGPFYVDGITYLQGEKFMVVTDNELKQIKLKFTDDIKTIIPLDATNYLVSNFVQVIPVKANYNYDKMEDVVKYASIKVTVSKQLNSKNYVINDGGISGIGLKQLQNLNKHDAIVVLMNCGLSELDAKYAIMQTNDKGLYSFDAKQNKKASVEKDDSLNKKACEITQKCDESNLIKVAVISGDKSNIDLALGLNLITYSNIKRFKLLVPEIYEMLDRLCKLLIVKRMGRSLFTVEETQLTQAITALDDIATSLGSL